MFGCLKASSLDVLSNVRPSYTDGNLYCRFNIRKIVEVKGRGSFNLADPKGLFLLVAQGTADAQGIEYHAKEKTASNRLVKLDDTSTVDAFSKGIKLTNFSGPWQLVWSMLLLLFTVKLFAI